MTGSGKKQIRCAYVSDEIDSPRDQKPLFETLRDNARAFPERAAIVFYGKVLTYGELGGQSERFARFLMDSGIQKGDRVALFLPSCPQYHIAHYGINKMGGVIAPCSPLYKEWELISELEDTGAKAIVTLDLLYPIAAKACHACGIQTVVVTSLHDFLPESPTMNLAPLMAPPKATFPDTVEFLDVLARYPDDPVHVDVDLEDIVQLQYTGGTTGLPKGAILTHGAKWFKVSALMDVICGGMNYLGHRGEDGIPLRLLAILPTFHIAGMLGSVDMAIALGATQVLMVAFDPVAAMQAIEQYRIDFFQASVPMNLAILDHPERKKYDLSSLRLCLTTSFGVQLTEALADRWKEDTGGCMLVEAAYGLTETHTFDSFMPLDRPRYEPGCCGVPIMGSEMKIVSLDDRSREVADGEVGEIVIRNPAVLKGYWNKPDATRNTLIDGWLYTGDTGRFDADGYLYWLGRVKEMIKVSGFSVFPEEVETFLLRHEAVDKVAVIGVPHEKKGSVIKAFVVPKPALRESVSQEAIIAWAREGISSYKVPQAIDFVDALPMSATGKVLRRVLLEGELDKEESV